MQRSEGVRGARPADAERRRDSCASPPPISVRTPAASAPQEHRMSTRRKSGALVARKSYQDDEGDSEGDLSLALYAGDALGPTTPFLADGARRTSAAAMRTCAPVWSPCTGLAA
jgi:hypothetical protein